MPAVGAREICIVTGSPFGSVQERPTAVETFGRTIAVRFWQT
jgi:hypothetical protein